MIILNHTLWIYTDDVGERENWSREPYPPKYVEVKGRVVLADSPDCPGGPYYKEACFLGGEYPEYGFSFNGWSGRETAVVREIIGPDGRVRIVREPDHDVMDLRQELLGR